MDKIQILYFLEDRAHERFIKAMVTRIAQEESMPVDSLNHDIRSARRGSRSLIEFKKFIRDIGKTESSAVDIIIVTRDGNCKGHNQCIKQLEKMIKPDHPLKKSVVFAVPDPHIVRWYIMDQKAFKEGVGIPKAPELPAYKCQKDYYKQLLRQTLKESNIIAQHGGAEYGERIVNKIDDVDRFSQIDRGCQAFVLSLRNFFKSKTYQT